MNIFRAILDAILRRFREPEPEDVDFGIDDPYLARFFCPSCGPVADVGHHPDCAR